VHSSRWCLSLAVLALALFAACSRKPQPALELPAQESKSSREPSGFIPSAAQRERFLAAGKEPTLRELSKTDYWLHYKMMQVTGLEKALGGEQQAVDALQAIGNAYERQLRSAEQELPRMLPAAFTGEGMATGFVGMGMGSFVGMITGGMTSAMVTDMSDERLAELSQAGPIKKDGPGGSWEMTVGPDGSLTHALEFDVNKDGVNGKVTMRMSMTACPDADGKVSIEIDVNSQMSMTNKPGSGGFVQTKFKYERFLDDDARLIDSLDGGASDLDIRIGGYENFQSQSARIRVGHERGGNAYLTSLDEQGFSIFRLEEVQRTQELIRAAELLQTLMAEMMLRGIGSQNGSPWESGRCIDLRVTNTPAKRNGIKPNTAFDLEVMPRTKPDGLPAGGTVTATLSGGARLQPSGGKQRADAKYGYAGPEKKDEIASIEFESRSKRGVGRATLSFDTKAQRAYRAQGGADEFQGTGDICDLTKTFTISGSGVTVTFEPSSSSGGTYHYTGNMSGFAVFGNGTYRVQFQGEAAVAIEATGPGTVKTPRGAVSRVGTETYPLTPIASDSCS
jgi:hypothetical protein